MGLITQVKKGKPTCKFLQSGVSVKYDPEKAFLSEGVHHLHKSDVSISVDYSNSKTDDFNCQFR